MITYRVHQDGINSRDEIEGWRAPGVDRHYWLRRETFRGRGYIALDYRRADGGVGTLKCFEGPTREADAAAELVAICERLNALGV